MMTCNLRVEACEGLHVLGALGHRPSRAYGDHHDDGESYGKTMTACSVGFGVPALIANRVEQL